MSTRSNKKNTRGTARASASAKPMSSVDERTATIKEALQASVSEIKVEAISAEQAKAFAVNKALAADPTATPTVQELQARDDALAKRKEDLEKANLAFVNKIKSLPGLTLTPDATHLLAEILYKSLLNMGFALRSKSLGAEFNFMRNIKQYRDFKQVRDSDLVEHCQKIDLKVKERSEDPKYKATGKPLVFKHEYEYVVGCKQYTETALFFFTYLAVEGENALEFPWPTDILTVVKPEPAPSSSLNTSVSESSTTPAPAPTPQTQ